MATNLTEATQDIANYLILERAVMMDYRDDNDLPTIDPRWHRVNWVVNYKGTPAHLICFSRNNCRVRLWDKDSKGLGAEVLVPTSDLEASDYNRTTGRPVTRLYNLNRGGFYIRKNARDQLQRPVPRVYWYQY